MVKLKMKKNVFNLIHFFFFLYFFSNAALARAIENMNGPLSPTDPDLLLLKAISTASTQCLHQCLTLLQRHQDIQQNINVKQDF